MNASHFITVWEWEADPCVWVPYEPKLCRHIEDAFRQSKGSITFNNGTHSQASFVLNFAMLKQENIYTKESTRVRQLQYPSTYPIAKGILWSWWSDFQWQLYDVPTALYIEEEYQKKCTYVDLNQSPLCIPNHIDFNTMVQVNKKTRKSRKIQRQETSELYPVAVAHGPSVRNGLHMNNNVPTYSNHVALVHSGVQSRIHHNTSTSTNGFPMYGGSGLQTHGISSRTPVHSGSGNLSTSHAGPSRAYPVQYGHGQTMSSYNTPHSGVASSNLMLHTPALQNSTSSVSQRKRPAVGSGYGSSSPPRKIAFVGGPLGHFTVPVTVSGKADDECAICLQNLTKPSDYDLTDPGNPADVQCVSPDILQLLKCRHLFHRICLQKMYNSGAKDGCLQCPTCKTIHGIKCGNQPKDGTMDTKNSMADIPGYPNCGSIVIVYSFNGGTQGENHPSPGQPYTAHGFPRTCYLPNNRKGQKVLRLLQKAFARQLIFTIGTSMTSGLTNTVVWNDIHHKTEGYSNRTGYGYPDHGYLDNVLAELAAHGVTDEDD